jgi:hypothetical protein
MAFPLQMMREERKSLLNVHYQRQIIVATVLIDAFAFSSLESMALVLIS